MQKRSISELMTVATANLATHFTWVQHQTSGMYVNRSTNFVLTDCGLPCDTFNAVCQASLTSENAHQAIQSAIDYFAQNKRPFSWWLSPGDQPENLAELLLEVGLQEDYSELAMAADLSQLSRGDLAPNGLEIRRVQTASQLQDFARVISVMWTPPDPEVVRFYQLAAPAILRDDSPMWFYVGYVDNQPVVTGEVTVADGVAGLYNICALPDFRQRGFGTAMTLRPLVDAKANDCTTAILQATEAGARVYKRLGFESFGKITEYKPTA
ncbi:MAG: GNAT family N-acetyltransferase [Anaerolineaceae bacterium]|nr:GNAT family N-acetyltransferase [Anaerolineaceae bacterium]